MDFILLNTILNPNRPKSWNLYLKQYYRKVLLSSFHLSGPTIGFHPQTRKLESPCTVNKQYQGKYRSVAFSRPTL